MPLCHLLALVSLLGSFSTSVILSLVAAVCLNYFFAPSLFELRVDSADDIVRIAAFLTTSLVVTALITKRKRAEEDLGNSNVRLEAAQRIAHVGWWERDVITGRVTVSDEVCRILGVRPVAQWLNLGPRRPCVRKEPLWGAPDLGHAWLWRVEVVLRLPLRSLLAFYREKHFRLPCYPLPTLRRRPLFGLDDAEAIRR